MSRLKEKKKCKWCKLPLKALIRLPQNGELFGFPPLGSESNNAWPMAQMRSESVLVVPQLPSLGIH